MLLTRKRATTMSEKQKNASASSQNIFAGQKAPVAPWVESMVKDYATTGGYRPADLRRLLGDPKKSVEVGARPSVTSMAQLFQTKQEP